MFKKIQNTLKQKPRLLAALLGALYTLGFAPFSLWVAGLLSLSFLFLLFKKQQTAKQAFTIGVVFAVAHYVTSLHWLIGSFYVTIGDLPVAIAVGGLCVVLLSFYLSLYIGLAGALVQKFKLSPFVPLLFVLAWVLGEFVRSSLTPTFAWNLAGYQWAYADRLLQLASIGGVYLLSFVFVLLAVSVVASPRWRLFAVFLFVVSFDYGYVRLAENPIIDVETADASKTHVRLISGNVNQFDKWKVQKRREFMQNYIEQSNTGEIADIVIWPETAVTSALNKHDRLRGYLADQIKAKNLITGAPYKGDDGQYYNSMFLLSENGEVESHYDKRHLVPFGEYFPYRKYFPKMFEDFLQGQGEYTPGLEAQKMISVAGINFAPLICGEIVLPQTKGLIDSEADYILNITNDAWFKGTIGPYQHFAFVKVRAATLGKHVIRASNYGVNAFVDNFGRLLKSENMDSIKALNLYI
ncbi:MAG: apolipoprotein N-acyltransferase [Alphaproteobacteria bacterium]|jgi:apolipoprotein N-acyltransferase